MSGSKGGARPAYEIDVDGYMLYPDKWSPEIGADIARKEGISPLTNDHRKVIDFARDYFDRYDSSPRLHKVTQATGFGPEQLAQLFPPHPPAILAKIAGLPNPRPVAGYDKVAD